MKCLTCNNTADEIPHHIVHRGKNGGGTDHPLNLAYLCFDCHYEIHHGIHSERKKEILEVCYAQIKQDLSKCWTGKIKPKIINLLENT